MINWELPHEKVACPHCGATDTQLWLQLLGVIRYSCNSCRKSFAIQGDTKTEAGAAPSSKSATSESSAPRRAS